MQFFYVESSILEYNSIFSTSSKSDHIGHLDWRKEIIIFDNTLIVTCIEEVVSYLFWDDVFGSTVHIYPLRNKICKNSHVEENCRKTTDFGAHLIEIVLCIVLSISPMQHKIYGDLEEVKAF